MKIRIFALARELGLDSKVLLGLCDEAGVPLRNALATITPEQRDQIVAYINNKGSSGETTEDKPGELAPTRESNTGKVRSIRQIPDKAVREQAPASEPEVAAEEPEPETQVSAEAPAEPVDAETPVETPAQTTAEAPAQTTAQTTAQTPAQTPTEDETQAAAGAQEEQPAAESEESKADDPPESGDAAASEKPTEEKPVNTSQKAASPLQRMSRPARREMKPIGSVKDREKPAETPKEKERPPERPVNRPLVAAPPSYQPPVVKAKPKKTAEKAMKPDMALSDIVDRASPLADQLKQLKQARAEHDGQLAPGGKKRQGARKGSLLQELRKSREEQRQQKKMRRKKRTAPSELKTSAQIEFPITVRNLSEAIGRPAKSIMGYFFKEGKMVTINDQLQEEEALEVAMELGVDLEIKRAENIEDKLIASLDHEDDEDSLEWRPPIITVLGHVDHGKTTLVDKLRSANVAAGEAGGITQHIAAYQIENDGQAITFVDTPGHAAFGEMRARGANVTDIIVLVIAADDGVMPQTEECISHAKNAGVPIIVALNKMDLEGVDDQRALQQLAQHDMLPSEWGGEYEVIRTSGETGLGLEELIETIQLTAELHEYRANPEREAIGVCLEAFRDEGRGVISWFIVQKGTLKVGDNVLCGTSYGRIRAIYDDRGNELQEAGPSMPVKVSGPE